MNKERAVEIVPGKLWITYDHNNNKTGTMSPSSSDQNFLIQYLADGTKIAHNRDDADESFQFEKKTELSSWYQKHVYGYPVPEIEVFDTQEREGLPCFTKKSTSSVYFAAGYYGIDFDNGGWMDAFCPKLSTLKKYNYIGPFKTLNDARIAIKRKKRNHD